jgi:hypothetical protein
MNRQERRLKTRSAPRGEQAVSVEHSNLWVGQRGSGSREGVLIPVREGCPPKRVRGVDVDGTAPRTHRSGGRGIC